MRQIQCDLGIPEIWARDLPVSQTDLQNESCCDIYRV